MNKKAIVGTVVVVLSLALAVAIGRHLDENTRSVIVGVVAGITAGVPTGFLLLVAKYRQERAERHARRTTPYSHHYVPRIHRQP